MTAIHRRERERERGEGGEGGKNRVGDKARDGESL